MFSYFIFLIASSVTFLCIHQVSSQNSSCTDKPVFTPSALVVKYGDPANATCDVCQKDCRGDNCGFEKAVGKVTQSGTRLLWTIDSMTEWGISLLCYNNAESGQHSDTLNVTVYQPPESVSISFVNHTGMMTENHHYILQCSVQNVAPVQSLTVTFYRGNTALGPLQSNSEEKKPVNETFTLNITSSREDDGAQYWCEAKLDLGPAGPQPPPVVTSEKLNATVDFETTTTKKPEPTTIKSTTRSTTRATRPKTTQSTTTTTKSTTISATTAPKTAVTARATTPPNNSSNRILTAHSFMCLMLLFFALI